MLTKSYPEKTKEVATTPQAVSFSVDESLNAILDRPTAKTETADYIFIIEEKRFVRIRFIDIESVEASRCYLIIHTTIGGRHIVIGSMAQLEKRLPAAKFCRVHRSWIVPVDAISVIAKERIMVGEKWFPLGSSFRRKLLVQLGPHVFNRRFLNELG